MRKLPQIQKYLLKTFVFALVSAFIFLLTVTTTAHAACALRDCVPGEEGLCEEGAKEACQAGLMVCCQNQWQPESSQCPADPNAQCQFGQPNSPLIRFAEDMKTCAETGNTTLECFVNGPIAANPQAAPGIFDLTVAGIAYQIGGLPSTGGTTSTGKTNQGAIGMLADMTGSLFTHPPASSVDYLAYLGRNLGISPAYAQGVGIGFQGLEPLIDIWKGFRNVAYFIFIIIFVLVGFAIMFRVRLNPQTVVSIQSALPKIVLTLLLITFSYAIGGLLIDLIYVGISFIFAVLGSTQVDIQTNIFSIFNQVWQGFLGFGQFQPMLDFINQVIQYIFSAYSGNSIFGIMINVLGTVIIMIAILFSLVKIFFALITSYISIILGIILAPFMLLLEAVPGQKGFANWLKLMISNILVFPATIGIFSLTKVISTRIGGAPGQLWVAPGIGTYTSGNYIGFIIAFGMLMATPSVISSIKKLTGAPEGMGAFAGGLMGGLAAGFAPIRGAGRAISTRWIEPYQMAARKARTEGAPAGSWAARHPVLRKFM
jgi:hypothetical protein